VSLVALALVASACGSAAKDASTASTAAARAHQSVHAPPRALPPGQTVMSDGDADNSKDLDGNPDPDGAEDPDDDTYTPQSYRYPDQDDKATLSYGRPAPAGERKSIADLVTRYYAAAATADGATACSLFSPAFRRAVPEDYAGGAGPPYLRGYKTCAAVVSHIFAHERRRIGVKVRVLSVRIKGGVAQAVFGSPTAPASRLFLQRQGRSWYLESLLGSPLP
jgi:hypothetical protein